MSKANDNLPQKSPVIHIERAEYLHVLRSLERMHQILDNSIAVMEALEERADNEYRQTLNIIKQLPKDEMGE
ncbi:MAG: hypothetical protein JXR49_19340 [Acidobacteria bacterium]|nr:hypothetical protein [Acidobacteriota bacterium]